MSFQAIHAGRMGPTGECKSRRYILRKTTWGQQRNCRNRDNDQRYLESPNASRETGGLPRRHDKVRRQADILRRL